MTVRISSRSPVRAKIVDEPPPGPAVERADLSEVLGREDAGVRIATSRHGTTVTLDRLGTLAGRTGDDGMTVAFGAPERGLPAILGIDVDDLPDEVGGVPEADGPGSSGFDRWLDTVPDQGSEVVRTEEAMFATLALLNCRE